MISTYHRYHNIKGSTWPEFTSIDSLEDFDDTIKKELIDRWQYIHALHFADLYVKSKNFDYVNFAHGGDSNFLIRLQIEQAIKFKPDYVLVGATSYDRIEVPLKEFDYKKLIRNYNHMEEDHIAGVDNNILDKVDQSYNLTIYPGFYNTLTENQKFAIKNYTVEIFNKDIQKTKDYLIIQNGLDLLKKHNIPYIFIPGPLKEMDWSDYNIWPNDKDTPWDYTKNNKDWHRLPNHNPAHIHKQLVKTFYNLTEDWRN